MTFVHVVTRVVLGIAVTAWPLHGSMLRWLGILVVVLAALLWAGVDGIRDARAHPSEREENDLTMMWLKAAAVTGLLSGAVCWVIGVLTDIALGENSLFFELTSGAAFTLLLVFVPAMFAVAVGRFVVHRDTKKAEGRGEAAPRESAAARAATPVAVGAAAGATSHEDQWSHEEDGTYGFAEGPYADDTPTEVFQPDGSTGRHRDDTEVLRPDRPASE